MTVTEAHDGVKTMTVPKTLANPNPLHGRAAERVRPQTDERMTGGQATASLPPSGTGSSPSSSRTPIAPSS